MDYEKRIEELKLEIQTAENSKNYGIAENFKKELTSMIKLREEFLQKIEIEFETKNEREVKATSDGRNNKCINPNCKGKARVTFCPRCIGRIDIFKRIKIFKQIKGPTFTTYNA